jgi:structural maintenance of chromosome 2
VRVGNLQELVYKQGQAGVTKATVTIVFNNADAAASPVGYESHKEIVVTRQVQSTKINIHYFPLPLTTTPLHHHYTTPEPSPQVVIGGKNKYLINGHVVQQSQVRTCYIPCTTPPLHPFTTPPLHPITTPPLHHFSTTPPHHPAPPPQVQNMFHSVQLNVNNPHFLIMQGRITKVLSMKPEETLGMIEEAAGTRFVWCLCVLACVGVC